MQIPKLYWQTSTMTLQCIKLSWIVLEQGYENDKILTNITRNKIYDIVQSDTITNDKMISKMYIIQMICHRPKPIIHRLNQRSQKRMQGHEKIEQMRHEFFSVRVCCYIRDGEIVWQTRRLGEKGNARLSDLMRKQLWESRAMKYWTEMSKRKLKDGEVGSGSAVQSQLV